MTTKHQLRKEIGSLWVANEELKDDNTLLRAESAFLRDKLQGIAAVEELLYRAIKGTEIAKVESAKILGVAEE